MIFLHFSLFLLPQTHLYMYLDYTHWHVAFISHS